MAPGTFLKAALLGLVASTAAYHIERRQDGSQDAFQDGTDAPPTDAAPADASPPPEDSGPTDGAPVDPASDAAADNSAPMQDERKQYEHPDHDLWGYYETVFLPYVRPFNSKYTPTIEGDIEGIPFKFPVDTGSTGLMIGAPLLSKLNLKVAGYKRGWEYLDSSSLLYSGRYIPLNITLYGEKGKNKDYDAMAHVPVLVVDRVVKCPGYNTKYGDGTCPEGKAVKSDHRVDKVTYMGVGFGRNTAGTGRVFGTPRFNPFLNIKSVNDHWPQHYRNGYKVSTKGITLGLTRGNTRGVVWTDLQKGATPDPRDWAEADMSFQVNADPDQVYWGKVLVDTGVPQMYIQSSPDGDMPNVTVSNPNPPPAYTKRVTDGTSLSFSFPDVENAVAGYSFEVGDDTFQGAPKYVQPVTVGSGPFVNTGRNFLYGFSIIFDAVAGRFGYVCEMC